MHKKLILIFLDSVLGCYEEEIVIRKYDKYCLNEYSINYVDYTELVIDNINIVFPFKLLRIEEVIE